MPRPSRRADVLRAASARFFRDGIAATGVDTVIADAGVAKMTLYGNFASKEALVVAYLEDRDQHFFELLEEEIARRGTPVERALAPLALYRRYLDEDGFRGCAFVNAAAELPSGHLGRAVIVRHKKRLRERWTELIAEVGVAEPDRIALHCLLLLEGAYTQAGLGLESALLDDAQAFARDRLADALSAPMPAGSD